MMDSTAGDDGDFPPNPFRSGGATQQQQAQPSLLPPTQEQEQQDFFSTPTPVMDPLSTTTPSPMDMNNNMQGSMNNNMNNNGMMQGNMKTMNKAAPREQQSSMQAPPPRSWWQSCKACCNMNTYAQYFDIDTIDIKTRILGSITHFYQPDYFRTNVVGSERTDSLKGPDLYGPFWVTMTLVFLVAVRNENVLLLYSSMNASFSHYVFLSHSFIHRLLPILPPTCIPIT